MLHVKHKIKKKTSGRHVPESFLEKTAGWNEKMMTEHSLIIDAGTIPLYNGGVFCFPNDGKVVRK